MLCVLICVLHQAVAAVIVIAIGIVQLGFRKSRMMRYDFGGVHNVLHDIITALIDRKKLTKVLFARYHVGKANYADRDPSITSQIKVDLSKL